MLLRVGLTTKKKINYDNAGRESRIGLLIKEERCLNDEARRLQLSYDQNYIPKNVCKLSDKPNVAREAERKQSIVKNTFLSKQQLFQRHLL
jgi:hypothetical protein